MKKLWATAAVVASVAGLAAMAVPQAMAIGDNFSTTSASGNSAQSEFGNSATFGGLSPQLSLLQGSLNEPLVSLPLESNVGSVLGGLPLSVQDIPILSSPQTQQNVENSTQAKGDEPMSHILEGVSTLSGNSTGNG